MMGAVRLMAEGDEGPIVNLVLVVEGQSALEALPAAGALCPRWVRITPPKDWWQQSGMTCWYK